MPTRNRYKFLSYRICKKLNMYIFFISIVNVNRGGGAKVLPLSAPLGVCAQDCAPNTSTLMS